MHYLWKFVVGAIARWVMSGAEHMNFMMTGILGIVGSFVGGSCGCSARTPPPRARSSPPGSCCRSSARSSSSLSTTAWRSERPGGGASGVTTA